MINGFRILEDKGSTGKRHYLVAECKICTKPFTVEKQSLKRSNRTACSRVCANQYWLDNLKESNGFKILYVGNLIKGKRIVIAECPYCTEQFRTSLQALSRTKQCGCLDYGIGYPKRLMRIKKNMIERCYNPSHPSYCRYGARNIKICDEWLAKTSDFFKWALANGYQDNLTLDRINNDGNYEPSNCRWATRKEQMQNTRKSKRV